MIFLRFSVIPPIVLIPSRYLIAGAASDFSVSGKNRSIGGAASRHVLIGMTRIERADKLIKTDQLIKQGFAMRPLRLDSLEIFEDVVRCGGFRAAALGRGVSSSAISQSISVLEEAVGIRLLNRTTRSVAPTEAGMQLLERLRPALHDIRTAVDDLNQLRERPSGTVRINAPGPAADHVLCP